MCLIHCRLGSGREDFRREENEGKGAKVIFDVMCTLAGFRFDVLKSGMWVPELPHCSVKQLSKLTGSGYHLAIYLYLKRGLIVKRRLNSLKLSTRKDREKDIVKKST